MTSHTADRGRLARIALGAAGFERATVWSAVGFAVAYVAFDVGGLLAPLFETPVPIVAIAGVIAMVTAVGVVAFTAITRGGFLPAVVLGGGPLVAASLRLFGPEPYTVGFAAPLSFLLSLVDPLARGVATAVLIGAVGYGVGRAFDAFLLAGGSGTEPDTDATE